MSNIEVGSDVHLRVSTEESWLPGRVVAIEPAKKAGQAPEIVVDVGVGENGAPTGRSGRLQASGATERDSAELANVKLRNTDFYRFNTGGRGGVDDLVQLTHLHEPAILDVLQTRFANDVIYTATGPILLAVNPFQRLQIYSRHTLEEYYSSGLLRAQGVTPPFLPPHVFQVADAAFRKMMSPSMGGGGGEGKAPESRNQSMLVSGESGAGKTETTKYIMQYLATVGRPKTAAAAVLGSGGSEIALAAHGGGGSVEAASAVLPSIERRVLDSNPILEAFGNAKTLRNENSSRFGKFIALQFTSRGELCGAKIDTYLLEKVRIVSQSKGERSYHIYYQVIAGADADEAARWKVGGGPDAFRIVNQSGCTTLRDASDVEEFAVTRAAMATMGVSPASQEGIYAALAGVLHLSNVTFEEAPVAGGAAAQPPAGSGAAAGKGAGGRRGSTSSGAAGACVLGDAASRSALATAATLLGVPAARLESVLTGKEISAGSETFRVNFSAAQCAAAAEALAKAVYSRLFSWVVWAVNRRIRVDESGVASFIGVLDIFGFESFATNSFEQLCINYCNETLQQHFNQFIFKLEQEEYIREQIDWSQVEFPDNQDCLDLIESRRPAGVLSILDEQCMLQTGSDEGFARKCAEALPKEHPRFTISNRQKVAGQFSIRHYAGEVVYTCAGFTEKNKDQIHREATESMVASSSAMVKTFFTPETWPVAGAAASSAPAPAVPAAGAGPGSRGGGLMSETVGAQFRVQLASLLLIVRATTPHYVRCLKPNPSQAPRLFARAEIVHQLRCGGVLEAVRVARMGYPVRAPHAEILRTYRFLAQPLVLAASRAKSAAGDWRGASVAVLSSLGLAPGTFQIGTTKVFLRRAAFDEMEARRQRGLRAAAVRIQCSVKRVQAQRRYRLARRRIVVVQSLVRRSLALRLVHGIRRRNAAMAAQAFWRMAIARLRFTRFRRAVVRLQAARRGVKDRRRVLIMRRLRAATMMQACVRMHRRRPRFVALRRAVVALQCRLRMRRARAALERHRKEQRDIAGLRESNLQLKQAVAAQAELVALLRLLAQRLHGNLGSKGKGLGAAPPLGGLEDAAAARAAVDALAPVVGESSGVAEPDAEAVAAAAAASVLMAAAAAAAVAAGNASAPSPEAAGLGLGPAASSSEAAAVPLSAFPLADGASPGLDGAPVSSSAQPSPQHPARERGLSHAQAAALPALASLLAAPPAQGRERDHDLPPPLQVGEASQLRARLAAMERRCLQAEERLRLSYGQALGIGAGEGAGAGAGAGDGAGAADGHAGGDAGAASEAGADAEAEAAGHGQGQGPSRERAWGLLEAEDAALHAAGDAHEADEAHAHAPGHAAAPGARPAGLRPLSTPSAITWPASSSSSAAAQLHGHGHGPLAAAAAGAGHGHGLLHSVSHGGQGLGLALSHGAGAAGAGAGAPSPLTTMSSDMADMMGRRQEKLEAAAAQLRRELEAARKRLAKAEEGAAHAADKAVKSEERAAQHHAEAEALRRQLDALQNDTLEQFKRRAEDAARELSSLRAAATASKRDVDLLRREAAALRAARDEREGQLAEREDEVAACREKAAMDSDVKMALAQRLDAAIVERAELSDLNRKLKAQLDSAESQRALKEKQIQNLTKQLADALTDNKRLQQLMGRLSPGKGPGSLGAGGFGGSGSFSGGGGGSCGGNGEALASSPSPTQHAQGGDASPTPAPTQLQAFLHPPGALSPAAAAAPSPSAAVAPQPHPHGPAASAGFFSALSVPPPTSHSGAGAGAGAAVHGAGSADAGASPAGASSSASSMSKFGSGLYSSGAGFLAGSGSGRRLASVGAPATSAASAASAALIAAAGHPAGAAHHAGPSAAAAGVSKGEKEKVPVPPQGLMKSYFG